jgi:hypothetical protein
MTQLSEEDLAKIYPTAKTYDELQAERELRREQGRPKHMPIKIALWASLSVPIIALIYEMAQRVGLTTLNSAAGQTNASMTVLTGVCIVILLGILGLASLYYLWSLINGLASKTLVNTTPLYFMLAGALLTATGISIVLHLYTYNFVVITLVPMVWVFIVSFIAAKVAR